jgi:hypothetical protein
MPCPVPATFVQLGLDPKYAATCEGTAQRNGFYGDGVVNAARIIRGR